VTWDPCGFPRASAGWAQGAGVASGHGGVGCDADASAGAASRRPGARSSVIYTINITLFQAKLSLP
jgi:hypothetical protein